MEYGTLKPFFIGFDDLFTKFEKQATQTLTQMAKYPPYNIRKVDENKYVIEMAVAGFGKTDIDVTLDGDVLRVAGNVNTEKSENNYLYKGIAERSFERNFSVADTVVVKNAELLNGMLKIWLENVIPDAKKPKKIEVNTESQLLSE